MNISIHALREEGDEDALDFLFEVLGFLSTPSARRATPTCYVASQTSHNFYPRPPRGGRLGKEVRLYLWERFLSTPSARRATGGKTVVEITTSEISIHALREEGDPQKRPSPCWMN